MGGAISHAADSVGGFLGNVFAAPFKTIFGASCDNICSGAWDVMCFIEHLCITNLVKLLLISGLCYIILIFLFLLFKLGIFQCIGKSLCKMCWAACDTYWSSIGYVTCFLWYKLINTKRKHRGRHFQDIEAAISTSSDESVYRRKRSREPKIYSRRGSRHHRHVKLNTREVSFKVHGRSRRRLGSSRRRKSMRAKHSRGNVKLMKRKRLK